MYSIVVQTNNVFLDKCDYARFLRSVDEFVKYTKKMANEVQGIIENMKSYLLDV